MTEDGRNELLRRADWRFLLPAGPPRRALCLASGSLAEATRAVAEETLTASPGGGCDVAVLEAPSTADLRAARDAVAPGGVLYAEWSRPVLGGRRAVVRRLARAGFEGARCWSVWPLSPRRLPRFWIPLESRFAAGAVLGGRSPAAGRAASSLAVALRGVPWWIARSLGLLPLRVTAVRVGAPPPGGGVLDAAAAAVEPAAPQTRLHALLLTGGQSALNKVVALVFGDGDRDPLVVVKAPRVAEAAATLDREHDLLTVVGAARPEGIPGVPRILRPGSYGDWPLVVESALTGLPLWVRLAAGDDPGPHAAAVTTLLAEIALATSAASLEDCDWERRVLEPKAADCRARDPSSEVQIAAAVEAARDLLHLPAVVVQGDCTPWNVLVAADGHRLVDWEGGEEQDVPLCDLTYFFVHLAMFTEQTYGSDREVETYRRLRDPSTPLGAMFELCERRYAAALGLPEALLAPLRLVALLHAGRPDLLRVELGDSP